MSPPQDTHSLDSRDETEHVMYRPQPLKKVLQGTGTLKKVLQGPCAPGGDVCGLWTAHAFLIPPSDWGQEALGDEGGKAPKQS